MSEKRILIVNADDFGMSQAVNQGIVKTFKDGLVRSTSLLVNMPETKQAVLLAKKLKTLEVGIHLNITEGFSVSPPEEVYLLADGSGRFNFNVKNIPESMRVLKRLVETDPQTLRQISLEFENQINQFNQFGLNLSHINIHHYISLLHPKLFEIYINTAKKFGVAYRGICRPMLDLLNSSSKDEQMIISLREKFSFPSPDLSISNLLDGTSLKLSNDGYCEMMKSKISELSQNKELNCLELIVHPVADNFSETDVEYTAVKKIETFMILNEDFGRYLKKLGFELHGYSGLLL
jgi:predicted glycoside hydrolase/deacetylase ChbG (UPF0249 family)